MITNATHAAIEYMLHAFGDALTARNIDAITPCWAIPALIVFDEGALAVADADELGRMFRTSMAAYDTEGVASTTAEILTEEPLSDRLFAVDVRWPYLDRDGHETGGETSHYLVWIDDDGHARIRVATSRA